MWFYCALLPGGKVYFNMVSQFDYLTKSEIFDSSFMARLQSARKITFQPIIYFSIWKRKGYLSVLGGMRYSVCVSRHLLQTHFFPIHACRS